MFDFNISNSSKSLKKTETIKWIIILFSISLLLILGNHILRPNVIMPAFFELESNELQKNISRVKDGFLREVENFRRITADWAFWDDTYKFVLDTNPEYIESNITPELLEEASSSDDDRDL